MLYVEYQRRCWFAPKAGDFFLRDFSRYLIYAHLIFGERQWIASK